MTWFSAWPMGYLKTWGPHADPVTGLTWGLIDLSLGVVVVVTGLVVVGAFLRRERRRAPVFADLAVGPEAGGLRWLWIGLALTVLALIASLAWTVAVMAAVGVPSGAHTLTLEITGHQWWWEVRYLGPTPAESFVTANEIHIPTGRPVLVRLKGADVIHSFWIPALAGKTDTIPGRTSQTWLQADKAGVYRGQCTEYCGLQHANMAAFVTAEAPAAFEAWRADQLRAATETPGHEAGEQLFVAHCGDCHAVRGTQAQGADGPDLTHLMSRQTLAAGATPNTLDGLSGWVANPQGVKPGTRMPAMGLSGPQLGQVVAYLETLT
jgi:cytochrome c oxidase subunit 2